MQVRADDFGVRDGFTEAIGEPHLRRFVAMDEEELFWTHFLHVIGV